MGKVNVTLSIPEELRCKMKKFKHVNWSEVAWKAFEEKIRREEMKKAAEEMDKLRAENITPEWSGVEEICKWRDASKS